MSDLNQEFVVNDINSNIIVETNDITISPNSVQLSIYTGSTPVANGLAGQLQFNNNGVLGGVANTSYNPGTGNLSLGNSANIKITGGANAYFLQTDGTGNLTWAQGTANVSGNGTAAGANTQIQISDGTGNFTSAPGFTFDNASNVLAVPGNVSANYYLGNGAFLTGINVNADVISNGNSNVKVYNNSNVTITINGSANVVEFGQTNTTFNGNITSNISTANIFSGNLYGVANSAIIANTVNDSAQPNITSVGTLSNLTVNGNITTNTGIFVGNGSGLTSLTGANVTGTVLSANTVTNAAQPNITSVGTLTSLAVNSDTINLGRRSLANGTQSISIGLNAGNGVIGNSNGSYRISIGAFTGGNSSNAGGVAIGYTAGQDRQGLNSIAIGNAAGGFRQGNNSIAIGTQAGYVDQPQNCIVINATGLDINESNANAFYVKPIRNATQANYLYYDSSTGEITYDSGSGGSNNAAGANTQVQFNTANALDASPNFTFNTASNTLTVTGAIVCTSINPSSSITSPQFISNIATGTPPLVVTSTTQVANLNVATSGTSGTVTSNAQPNITSVGSLIGLTVLNTISGNISGSSATVRNAAQPNITSVGTLTSLTATGNITGGNLIATGATIKSGFANASTIGTASTQAGVRKMVNDSAANPVVFNATYIGGGANIVPVFSDGTNWRYG